MTDPVYASQVRVEYKSQTHTLLGGAGNVSISASNVFASIASADGNYAYLVADSGLEVVDITDRSAPVHVGATTDLVGLVSNQAITGLALDGTGQYLYVPDGGTNLYTLDLADPTQPNLVDTLAVSAGGNLHVIAVLNDVLYLLCDSANILEEIDISTPDNPAVLNSVAAGSIAFGVRYCQITPDEGYVMYPSSPSTGIGRISMAKTTVSPPTLAFFSMPDYLTVGGDQIYPADNVYFVPSVDNTLMWTVGRFDLSGVENYFWLVFDKGVTWEDMSLVSDEITGGGAGAIRPKYRIQNEPQVVRGIGTTSSNNRMITVIENSNRTDVPVNVHFWRVTATDFQPRIDDVITMDPNVIRGFTGTSNNTGDLSDSINSVKSFNLITSDGWMVGGGSTAGNLTRDAVLLRQNEVQTDVVTHPDHDDPGWEDITEYVLSEPGIHVEYGIRGTKPTDRVASTGTMTFRVKNFGEEPEDYGKFSPEHPDLLDNFKVGAPIRLIVGDVGAAAPVNKPSPEASSLKTDHELADGLVLALLFNEGEGGVGATITDYSGQGNHGAIGSDGTPATFWAQVETQHDPAFILDRTPDLMYCQIPHSDDFDYTTGLTVVVGYAARGAEIVNGSVMVGKSTDSGQDDGFTMNTAEAGNIAWQFTPTNLGETSVVGTSPSDDDYHQVVCTFDNANNTSIVYIDGVEFHEKNNVNSDPVASLEDLFIGRMPLDVQPRGMAAYVFYVYIWKDRVLTEEEVESINDNPYQMFGSPSYSKFFGVVKQIQPRSGQYRERYSDITCVDAIDFLAAIKPRNLDIQIDATGSQLVRQLVDNATHLVYGDEISIDETTDVYPFAFDLVRDEKATLLTEITRVVLSERGYFYIARQAGPLLELGDGGIRFESRDSRRNSPVNPFILENLTDLVTVHTSDEVVNRVRSQVHPRRVDDWEDENDAVVLYSRGSLTAGQDASAGAQLIEAKPGKRVFRFTANYRDPEDTQKRVGGLDMVYPIALTDFKFTSGRDGTGADLTGNISVLVWFGGTSAIVQVRNQGAVDGYLTFLQLRGRGLYSEEPITAPAETVLSVFTLGPQEIVYDMPYLGDGAVAEEVSEKILTAYENPRTFIKAAEFIANESAEYMNAFLVYDIGDKIPIIEDVHGFTGISPWKLGVAGFSELGLTTYLGGGGVVYIIQNVSFDITGGSEMPDLNDSSLIRVRWGLVPGDLIL
jgi:hypothetical protein